MEVQTTVIPGKETKSQHVKPKFKGRTTLPPKSNDKEQPVQRRVFGSVRNPNLQDKTIPENSKRRRPSLKPTPAKPVEPVQINPSAPDVSQKTTHNPKEVPNEPTTKPFSETIKPVQTPVATKLPPKTAPNSKSVPNKTTIKPSPKTAKPVQTTTPTLEVPKKTAQNLESVTNETTTPSTNEVSQKASIKPKTVTKEPMNLPSPKPEQPEHTASPTLEGSQKATHNSKMVPNEPTIVVHSPKAAQPVHTTLSETNKTIINPKPVQNNPTIELSPKTSKLVEITPLVAEVPKKTASTAKPKKKKSVSFPEGNSAGSQTPSLAKAKPRVSGTPYYTAKRCSKCRFDRMETSSYWLSLIKLAENVDKHTVSVGFFKLALEAKAEPIRVLRIELNRYISRHGNLSGDPEWGDVISRYGLNVTPNDYAEVQACENGSDLDQANDDSTEQNVMPIESNLEALV